LPYSERIDILSNDGSDNDIPVRSKMDETRVFDVISNLFPEAHACDIGIKTFYFQVKEKVKENFGVILNNDLTNIKHYKYHHIYAIKYSTLFPSVVLILLLVTHIFKNGKK
jgi:hypothetical protein